MSFSRTEFGNRIRRIRLILGMSQSELAEKIQISAQHLRAIESGRRGATLENLCKLSEELEVTTDLLLKRYSPRSCFISKALMELAKDLPDT